MIRFRMVWWVRLCLFIVFMVVLWMGLRYFFGETTIVATLDGEPLEGATVEINGEVVGKTPFTTHLSPGFHTFRVLPPVEGLCVENEWTGFMWTIIRGMDFEASFHTKRKRGRAPAKVFSDLDVDGVPDAIDNCPYLSNPNQANGDCPSNQLDADDCFDDDLQSQNGLALGDVCDPDRDS